MLGWDTIDGSGAINIAFASTGTPSIFEGGSTSPPTLFSRHPHRVTKHHTLRNARENSPEILSPRFTSTRTQLPHPNRSRPNPKTRRILPSSPRYATIHLQHLNLDPIAGKTHPPQSARTSLPQNLSPRILIRPGKIQAMSENQRRDPAGARPGETRHYG